MRWRSATEVTDGNNLVELLSPSCIRHVPDRDL